MTGPVSRIKPIEFSDHTREKMLDRGATEDEIVHAIRSGSVEPTRKGRMMFRKNLEFNSQWQGKFYPVKHVVPVVAEESERLIVVTVLVYYF
ncbi:MAG: hypothetical protein ABIF09_02255 [Gemmatimonadota bacterium]